MSASGEAGTGGTPTPLTQPPAPLPPPVRPAAVVATEEADTTASYVQGYFKCEMFTDYSNHAAACAARCLARDWCWYWTVQPAT